MPMAREIEDQNLTERQTAQMLAVSVKTLQAWRATGKGPAYLKISRAIRYPLPDIRAFIKQCRVEPVGRV